MSESVSNYARVSDVWKMLFTAKWKMLFTANLEDFDLQETLLLYTVNVRSFKYS